MRGGAMSLPVSIEAEQMVLGAILLESKCWYVLDKLYETDFYAPHHREILKVMKEMNKDQEPIELYSVYEKVNKSLSIEVLTKLMGSISTTATIDHYIGILKDRAIKREILLRTKAIEKKLLDDGEKGEDLKTTLIKSLDDIETHQEDEGEDLKAIMLQTLDNLDELYQQRDDRRYYTGLTYYDMATAGLHREEVTTIAARPSVGKSALALQMGKKLARNGLKVLIISREMSKLQIGKRLIASETGINGNKLRRGGLNDNDWSSIGKGISVLTSTMDMIIDTTSDNITAIRSKVREKKADVLIIDYLQLLRGGKRYQSREQEVSEISRDIKALALEFKIPVIQLAQLNRNAELKRPTKADLRESGSIEQDSDNIVFLHLPTESELETMVKDPKSLITWETIKNIKDRGLRLVKIIIEKQRDGDVGEFEVVYNPRTLTFYDLRSY
ncbi:MAG: DnaB domain protein helicase domain protein [Anaerosolibacter sp.]|jgi:replicative DNA helicase|uniref:replicative DNA helicase n=1 Tax=Anaerosolibacter sp. TaxID=1872527 RepID=UPI002608626B|nr:DnaB-like helicase C-terminal domain-containing protein [Anaerosolibacter sp.]MDF2548790.1 DnaB domain protein helicase domain protein [Anaerosolibacter sp.]